MAEYSAPLRDMKFVIKELAGLSEINALPGCEEATPDLVDAVLEGAGKFAAGALYSAMASILAWIIHKGLGMMARRFPSQFRLDRRCQ